jgi:uroporphyrinogen decarboxylase
MGSNNMKAIGGVGNGIFECVQDITGYINLCYIKVDDPILYRSLFEKMGEALFEIWDEFLKRYSDIYCVVRMGDDLGFKTNTLLPAEDIIDFILPGYRKIINLSHSYEKPFLLHSCGNIFSIMDHLIEAGIDAKHSNEDEIAPMSTWYDMYGDRLGNFGGIDSGILCDLDKNEIKEYTTRIFNEADRHGGVALGSGNSIPDYIPVGNYLTMVETLNGLRCGKNPR